jgi:uncharacterized membrane protein YebE (DUF533 family)
MHRYLVLFRDGDAGPETGRAAFVQGRVAATGAMIARLLNAIRAKRWQGQVGRVGDATAAGAVAIDCTAGLAAKLRRLPEIEAVIRD